MAFDDSTPSPYAFILERMRLRFVNNTDAIFSWHVNS